LQAVIDPGSFYTQQGVIETDLPRVDNLTGFGGVDMQSVIVVDPRVGVLVEGPRTVERSVSDDLENSRAE
jgi:hypothetical protein